MTTTTASTEKSEPHPGGAMGEQGSAGGPASTTATEHKGEGGGQKRSKERGSHTRSKKQPGKRPHSGGSSA